MKILSVCGAKIWSRLVDEMKHSIREEGKRKLKAFNKCAVCLMTNVSLNLHVTGQNRY